MAEEPPKNELQVAIGNIDFQGHRFSVYGTLDDPQFLASEVIEALEYRPQADGSYPVAQLLSRDVDEDKKLLQQIVMAGQSRKMWFLTELGLYQFVGRSHQPKAKPFQDFTWNLLRDFRRRGFVISELMKRDPAAATLAVLQYWQHEAEMNKEALSLAVGEIGTMLPKVNFCDSVLNAKANRLTVRQIANAYSMGAEEFNDLLHEIGIQYKSNGQWLLYQDFRGNYYTTERTHKYKHKDGSDGAKPHTYWTHKGRMFLYEKLAKKKNMYPQLKEKS